MAHTTNIVLGRVLWCTCVAQQCANVDNVGKTAVQEHCLKECGSAAVHRCSAPVLGAISCQLKRRKQAVSSMKAVKEPLKSLVHGLSGSVLLCFLAQKIEQLLCYSES